MTKRIRYSFDVDALKVCRYASKTDLYYALNVSNLQVGLEKHYPIKNKQQSFHISWEKFVYFKEVIDTYNEKGYGAMKGYTQGCIYNVLYNNNWFNKPIKYKNSSRARKNF